MNTQQLYYFVTAAETLNFSKAAEKCYISQTAMSLQIKSLEQLVGVPLFNRDQHHVELTAAGKIYLEEAREILRRSEEAVHLARTAAEGISGNLSIGFLKGYGLSSLSASLSDFRQAFPGISLQLVRDNMTALFGHLEEGSCDVIFNLAPYVHELVQFEHRFISRVPMMAILSAKHPLAEEETLRYRDLEHESFIIMQPKDRSNNEAEEVLLCHQRGGFLPNIVGRETEIETMLLMIAAGLGLGMLPEYGVRWYKKDEYIRIIPLVKDDGTPETMDFEMCWAGDSKNPALRRFLRWVEDRQYYRKANRII